MLIFDEDGDALIILPYATSTAECPETSNGQETDPMIDENGDNTLADSTVEKNAVRMKVSRKHLLLASRRAQKVFLGPWKESESKETDGLYHWSFEPVFTPEAFEIVLNIIHGHTKKVPNKIGLAPLADIAAVVDDLQCEDAVWFIVKSWIRQLEGLLPDSVCEDLSRWILIASMFDEPTIFQRCTALAIRYSCTQLDSAGLPIQPSIIGKAARIYYPRPSYAYKLIQEDAIESRRTYYLDLLVVHLEDQRDKLIRGTLGCDLQCRSSYLGALVQGMHSTGILPISDTASPNFDRSEAPYRRLSPSSAMQAICDIPLPDVYGIFKSPHHRTPQPMLHKCALQSSHKEYVETLRTLIAGLRLETFVCK
ncbi:unnamed protein product [Clonostachys rosea]|uniref:BTB domain-containing protein n=1 Tax=Bionectria ochroleuca TaxID=29856 RepID=A0ABY6UZ04_BIOOC|nr:unnamed protein product [Clonostachys rosea]